VQFTETMNRYKWFKVWLGLAWFDLKYRKPGRDLTHQTAGYSNNAKQDIGGIWGLFIWTKQGTPEHNYKDNKLITA